MHRYTHKHTARTQTVLLWGTINKWRGMAGIGSSSVQFSKYLRDPDTLLGFQSRKARIPFSYPNMGLHGELLSKTGKNIRRPWLCDMACGPGEASTGSAGTQQISPRSRECLTEDAAQVPRWWWGGVKEAVGAFPWSFMTLMALVSLKG